MQIQSLASPVRSISTTRRGWVVGAACAAALATGAVVANSGDAPVAAPVPAAAAGGVSADLAGYDAALLHHHGVRVPAGTTLQPMPAQRRAADRFHHR